MWSSSTPGRPRSRPTEAERGFTLVEALVALVIVATTAVATIEAFGAGLRAQHTANQHLEALALAEARLNEVATLTGDSLARHPAASEGGFPPPLHGYRWRLTLARAADAPALWEARVVVRWPGGGEALQTVFYRPSRIVGDVASAR